MAQKRQSQRSKLLFAIIQLILLPLALGIALDFGLMGIQIFVLVYLLLFVRGKIFPAQFLISPRDRKSIYYFLFMILSATMWIAYFCGILPSLIESIMIITPDKQWLETVTETAKVLFYGPNDGVSKDFLILPLYSHPALERWYWSALFAFLLVLAITMLHLISEGRTMMNTYLADYDRSTGDYPFWSTLWTMISISLGINKRIERVTGGELTVLRAPSRGWAQFAGPGLLIVDDGHAVVLERSGTISRIVGAGITLTEAFERVSLIVPLRTEALLVDRPVRNVVTKDGVVIKEFNLFVYYQMDPGAGQCPEGSEFPYDPEHIRRIWRLVGTDFDNIKSAMETIADTSLRDVIARYDLDEVFAARTRWSSLTTGQLEPRQRIKKEVRKQINTTSQEFLGIEVVAVDMGEIAIPKEAKEQLLKQWMVNWDQRIETTKAETEKLIQMTRANARMQTIQAIAQGLRQLIGEEAEAHDLIALRFIEYLERRCESLEKQPETTVTGPDEAWGVQQELGVLQALERLGVRPERIGV